MVSRSLWLTAAVTLCLSAVPSSVTASMELEGYAGDALDNTQQSTEAAYDLDDLNDFGEDADLLDAEDNDDEAEDNEDNEGDDDEDEDDDDDDDNEQAEEETGDDDEDEDASAAQAALSTSNEAERRRRRRRRSSKKGPLHKSAEDMVNGLLNGNLVRGYSGSMGMVRALGNGLGNSMNPRTMMLGGLTNGLSPGLPNLKKLSNSQLRAHMDALTAAFQQMQLISACHHTYNALGLGQGVSAALQGGLPNVAGMGLAGPNSMVHPALNPLNPRSPLNPFLAHHMALNQAGALFKQLNQAQAQAMSPPVSQRAPVVMQRIPQQPAGGQQQMHTFSVGSPAMMSATGQQQPVTHHVYHYPQMMMGGAGGMGGAAGGMGQFMQQTAAINHAGNIASAMSGGY